MSVQVTVLGKAVDSGGPGVITQNWVVGGGASSAEDAASLIGTPGGDLTSFANGDIEEFWFDPTLIDAIPSNATITNLRMVCAFTGLGTLSCRYNNATDGANPPFDALTGFQDFPDSTPFGGLGAWTPDDFRNDNNFGFIRVTGGAVAGHFYCEITYTIPDWTTPSSIDAAGGDVVTFEALDGNFFNANYEVSWFDFPVQTSAFDSIINGHKATDTSPARAVGSASVNIYDTRDINHGNTQPYSLPSFVFAVTVIDPNMEFLEDPSGTPTSYAVTGGVTMGSSYMGYLSKDVSGVYTFVANQRFDREYVRAGSTLTQDVQIPNPFAELGFTECDDE